MNVESHQSPGNDYLCPGEKHPISRAVHLGRLAAFYPACRQCSRRGDTGSLSPHLVERIAETDWRGRPRALFHDEGASGVYLNDLTPAVAQKIAAAFGAVIVDREETTKMQAVVLAGDGRPLSAELVAAAAEGLRSTGCNVIDIGPATAACLAFAVRRLEASGGLLVGNPGGESHTVGLKFWAAGARPLSLGGSLEPMIERYEASAGGLSQFSRREMHSDGKSHDRRENGTVPLVPRVYGSLKRFQAEEAYLAHVSQYYHAMRPLRVVVDSASRPFVDYLRKLASAVECEIIPCRSVRGDLPRQIRDDAAHLAVCIDGDGEACRAIDEQGHAIPPERLLLLLASHIRPTSVVLETETSPMVAERLRQRGIRAATCSPRRADMAAAMIEHVAALGGGPSGRVWHVEAGLPMPDALMTVTRLIGVLSRGDEPLSAVLDREAGLG